MSASRHAVRAPGRAGDRACRRALADQPAGCCGRAFAAVSHAVFAVGRAGNVGGVRDRRPGRGAARAWGEAVAEGAFRADFADRAGQRGACAADRGHDGAGFESGAEPGRGAGRGMGRQAAPAGRCFPARKTPLKN